MASMTMTLWVPGRPRTKGSLQQQQRHDAAGRLVTRRAKSGREVAEVRLTDTPESKAWRAEVARAIRRELDRWELPPVRLPIMVGGHLIVWVPFDAPTHPHAGDADKHLRQLFDAMTDARAWDDDRQASGWYVEKRTALDRSGPGYQFWWYEQGARS